MTGWERLGIGGLSQGYLSGRLSPSAVLDDAPLAQIRACTLRARAELTRLFEDAGYPVIPSQANFILVRAPDEHAMVSGLAEHAIAVRPGTALGIPGTCRVSVPSQRGLRLLHSVLRPTPGRPPAKSCRRTGRNPQHPRQRPPSHDFGYLRIRSLVLPSNE